MLPQVTVDETVSKIQTNFKHREQKSSQHKDLQDAPRSCWAKASKAPQPELG